MYVVLQSDSIQDLGRNFLVWVYPFNHKVKQPPEWLHDIPQTRLGATGEILRWPPSRSLLCVSQWSSDRCVYQSGGESAGIKPGADACSCIPDYGVEWMVGEPAEFVRSGSFPGGLHRGYSRLGWRRQR